MTQTPEQIAAGLTEEQKGAVRGIFMWRSAAEQEVGERVLYELGLWNPLPKHSEKIITPLGLAVRAVLERGDG